MTQRNYFVNANENDIITILQSGYKSPVVSYIPSNFVDVLKEIKGITSISPEVHSLVLIKNEPVTLHGITSTFFEMNSPTIIAGKGLSYIVTSNKTNVIIAGYGIAQVLNLKVGTYYNIYSSNTNSYYTFYLAGIVKFNSFNDEEIFTNIDVASYMRSQSSMIYYSMIRIKINTSLVTKDQINTYLSQKFLLKVNFFSHFQNLNVVQNKTVKIFQDNGIIAGTNITDSKGYCTFSLPIGFYTLYFTTNNIVYNQSFIFIGSAVQNIYVDPFNSTVNANTTSSGYALSIDSYYGNNLVPATSFVLTGPRSPRYFYYNLSHYDFSNLPQGNYTIKANYGNLSVTRNIYLNSNLIVDMNFTHQISLIVKDFSNNALSGFDCSVLNYQTNQTIFYHTNQTVINLDLENSIYNITLNTALGSRSFILPVNSNLTKSDIITYVGNGSQVFNIQNQSNQSFQNITMYERDAESTTFNFVNKTDSNGNVTFPNFVFGKEYYLLFSDGVTDATFLFNPTIPNSTALVYHPFHTINLTATFLYTNGSTNYIQNTQVGLKPLSGSTNYSTTGVNGNVSFTLQGELVGNISITYKNFTKNFEVDTYQQTDYQFSVGFINLHLNVLSTGYQLIPNATIIVISKNYNETFYNTNGTLNLFLPSNTISDVYLENLLSLNDYNYSSFKNDYFLNYLYTITVSDGQSQSTLFLPKTYRSSNLFSTIKLPYVFNLRFFITDVLGVDAANAQILLTNSQSSFTTITDLYGSANVIVNSGNYSLVIKYIDYEFDYSLSVTQNQVVKLKLPIFINKISLVPWKPNLSALSGKQYLNEFYSSSITYFLEVFIILITIAVFILILLFSSVVKLTLESIENEIFILNLLGTSKYEMFLNLLYNFQMRSVLSSAIGIAIGMYLTQFLNTFNSIQVLGFIFYSQFSLFYFIFFLVSINIVIFVVLVNVLRKMNVIYPIEFLKRM